MVPAQKIIMIRVFVKHLHLKLLTRNLMNDDLTHTRMQYQTRYNNSTDNDHT